MPGKTKSSKIIRSKNNVTRKKRGGFLGMGTSAVNITTEGVILNENYRKGNVKFQHELLGLELNFDKNGKPERFYKRSDESYSGTARLKIFGKRLNTTSVIEDKVIEILRVKDILCMSHVNGEDILFKFKKMPDDKKITLSRMFKSNWYSIDVIWTTGGVEKFKGFASRSPKMLSTLRNLLPGNKIVNREDIVNKHDTEFWFNFKPYFDLNVYDENKRSVVINKILDSADPGVSGELSSRAGLNIMHQLTFSPTTVDYTKEDLFKKQYLTQTRHQSASHASNGAAASASGRPQREEASQLETTEFSKGLINISKRDDYANVINALTENRLKNGIVVNSHIPAFQKKLNDIGYNPSAQPDFIKQFFINLIKNNREVINRGHIAQNEILV
jgi:hypothetical protein